MTVVKPTPEDVGRYYDTMGPFYQTLWGDSIHFGYWPDPTDSSVTMAQAQQIFTDLLISHMNLKPGQRVLDVGCGTGRPGIQLARTTETHVTGITVSHTQQETASNNARESGLISREQALNDRNRTSSAATPTADFELVNAMEMPYGDGAFDAAWAFESIFHMPSRLQVFKEMARVVRPGGRVVVADFVSIEPLTQEEIDVVYPAFAVGELGTLNAYINDLKEAGLTNIQCRDVTINTIRPSNRATMGALQTEEALATLRGVYGEETVASFLGGWDAIRKINETLSYIVFQADRP
jgi:cyclopropane fatty-acyl-phospholipid synthase-like methyltransferase